MACERVDCLNRAHIRETRRPHRQFCTRDCQAHYWLGVTPRLPPEEAGERCRLRLGQTELEARVTVACVLDVPERALLHGLDEQLGLARGALCRPELRLAYRFEDDARYDFLHWLDFAPPLSLEADGQRDVRVAWALGATQVTASHYLLVAAALRMGESQVSAPDLLRLEAQLLRLAEAVYTEEYGEAADWELDQEGRFQYRTVEAVLCHLMYLHAHDAADQLAGAVAALMRRGVRALRVTSVQDYVAHALAPLGHLGRARTTGARPDAQLVFALPGLREPDWKQRLADYVARQEYAPASGMPLNARYVTIVAREPGGRLLGYVTCALYAPVAQPADLQRLGAQHWGSAEMRQFATARSDGVYDLLLIEGLSVDREWRGGRQDSVAVLLVFHALYFALQCARDCGLQRVSCESAARTTALIMRQFGGVHQNARAAVEWMEQRLKQQQSCAEDLRAFAAEYDGAAALMRGSEAEQVQQLRAQLGTEVAQETRLAHRWLAPMRAMGQLLEAEGSDTFLWLGDGNRRLHEQMARLERLLTEQGEKQPRPREQEVQAEDEPRKRIKATGAPLTTLALGALERFALQ